MKPTGEPTTIVLNGLWGRVLSGVILAAILSGGSGLLVALRIGYASEVVSRQLGDHEARIRALEASLGDINSGIRVLLERTSPKAG